MPKGGLPRMVSFQNSLQTGRSSENLSFLPLMKECPKTATSNIFELPKSSNALFIHLLYSPAVHSQLPNERIINEELDITAVNRANNRSFNKGEIYSFLHNNVGTISPGWHRGSTVPGSRLLLSDCPTHPEGAASSSRSWTAPPTMSVFQAEWGGKKGSVWPAAEGPIPELTALCSLSTGRHLYAAQASGQEGSGATGLAQN